MRATAVFAFWLLLAAAAHAGLRTGADYTIVADALDGGGGLTVTSSTIVNGNGETVPLYSNNGSLSEVAGVSTTSVDSETMKSGFVGQL